MKKYGGYYAWDDDAPAATVFEDLFWQTDKVYRWAVHANRAEFDTFYSITPPAWVCTSSRASRSSRRIAIATALRLNYPTAVCSVVRYSSRQRAVDEYHRWAAERMLSAHRNIAIWTHVIGGRRAEALEGDWNIFHEPNYLPSAASPSKMAGTGTSRFRASSTGSACSATRWVS